MSEKLKALVKPFPMEYIEWRPGATNRDKTAALGLAYVDPRCYQDRLNDVFGLEWGGSRNIYFASGKVVIEVTITVPTGEGGFVSRSGVGEEFTENVTLGSKDVYGNENAVTTADAQALKRACVEFGLGAYLYGWGNIWADYDKVSRRFTDKGMSKLNQSAHNLTEQAMRQWGGEKQKTLKKQPLEKKPETARIKQKKVQSVAPNEERGPKAVKLWLLSEAEAKKQRPLNNDDVKQLNPLLNNILGGDEARHLWLQWTYDVDSAKKLTGAQKDVLWNTMNPSYSTETSWVPTGDRGKVLAEAIKAMYQEALKEPSTQLKEELKDI